MVLERREGLAGPVLQVGIVAALRIALEQVDGILVRADLHGVEFGTEVFSFAAFNLSSLLWCELSRAAGSSAFTLPPETISFNSVLVLVWSVIICEAKVFSVASPFCWASLLDSSSNMSDIATCLTKSGSMG